jgi:pimeloyl-ACP methyl ester carboxylesterase
MGAGMGEVAAASPTVAVLTPEELMQECGVAPTGLAPHIATIQSSKTPEVQLSMAIQGDPSRPPVVLVHGFPDFWCGWAEVIPELAGEYYVVALDMRGYNRSSKPGNPDDPQDLAAYMLPELERDLADVVHYAATQTQQKVSVVAHDWGAIVAWPFAHDYPEDLARLLAISVSHPRTLSRFLASGDPALASAQAQQAQALTYISELVMNDSPAQFGADGYKKLFDSLDQKHLHKPNAFPEVEREAYKRMWDADNQASFKSQIKYYRANFGAGGGQNQSSDLITPVPTAFIAPVYDGAILYPHSMDYLREYVAQDQPVLLRPIETGHFPQFEEPARLASMIRQFVDVDWQTP